MICRKEQYTMQGEEKDLLMWDALRESRLQMEKTAYENGLKTGKRILLVQEFSGGYQKNVWFIREMCCLSVKENMA